MPLRYSHAARYRAVANASVAPGQAEARGVSAERETEEQTTSAPPRPTAGDRGAAQRSGPRAGQRSAAVPPEPQSDPRSGGAAGGEAGAHPGPRQRKAYFPIEDAAALAAAHDEQSGPGQGHNERGARAGAGKRPPQLHHIVARFPSPAVHRSASPRGETAPPRPLSPLTGRRSPQPVEKRVRLWRQGGSRRRRSRAPGHAPGEPWPLEEADEGGAGLTTTVSAPGSGSLARNASLSRGLEQGDAEVYNTLVDGARRTLRRRLGSPEPVAAAPPAAVAGRGEEEPRWETYTFSPHAATSHSGRSLRARVEPPQRQPPPSGSELRRLYSSHRRRRRAHLERAARPASRSQDPTFSYLMRQSGSGMRRDRLPPAAARARALAHQRRVAMAQESERRAARTGQGTSFERVLRQVRAHAAARAVEALRGRGRRRGGEGGGGEAAASAGAVDIAASPVLGGRRALTASAPLLAATGARGAVHRGYRVYGAAAEDGARDKDESRADHDDALSEWALEQEAEAIVDRLLLAEDAGASTRLLSGSRLQDLELGRWGWEHGSRAQTEPGAAQGRWSAAQHSFPPPSRDILDDAGRARLDHVTRRWEAQHGDAGRLAPTRAVPAPAASQGRLPPLRAATPPEASASSSSSRYAMAGLAPRQGLARVEPAQPEVYGGRAGPLAGASVARTRQEPDAGVHRSRSGPMLPAAGSGRTGSPGRTSPEPAPHWGVQRGGALATQGSDAYHTSVSGPLDVVIPLPAPSGAQGAAQGGSHALEHGAGRGEDRAAGVGVRAGGPDRGEGRQGPVAVVDARGGVWPTVAPVEAEGRGVEEKDEPAAGAPPQPAPDSTNAAAAGSVPVTATATPQAESTAAAPAAPEAAPAGVSASVPAPAVGGHAAAATPPEGAPPSGPVDRGVGQVPSAPPQASGAGGSDRGGRSSTAEGQSTAAAADAPSARQPVSATAPATAAPVPTAPGVAQTGDDHVGVPGPWACGTSRPGTEATAQSGAVMPTPPPSREAVSWVGDDEKVRERLSSHVSEAARREAMESKRQDEAKAAATKAQGPDEPTPQASSPGGAVASPAAAVPSPAKGATASPAASPTRQRMRLRIAAKTLIGASHMRRMALKKALADARQRCSPSPVAAAEERSSLKERRARLREAVLDKMLVGESKVPVAGVAQLDRPSMMRKLDWRRLQERTRQSSDASPETRREAMLQRLAAVNEERERAAMLVEEWNMARAQWWGSRDPPREGAWRVVRVFISSTFNDMHGERDALTRFVFPELNERLSSRRVRVVPVDLRWGLTAEDTSDSGLGALEHCLHEIDRAKPFCVCLLGERYGWMPPSYRVSDLPQFAWIKRWRSGCSITAMELYHAFLRKPFTPTHAFCYQRDPAVLRDVPPDQRCVFEDDQPGAEAKLRQLRQEIRDHRYCQMQMYPCDYAGEDDLGRVSVKGLGDFARMVTNDLYGAICSEFPKQQSSASPLEVERSYHTHFVAFRARHFIGRGRLLEEAEEAVTGRPLADAQRTPLVVVGASGSGKTTFVTYFASHFPKRHPEAVVITHVVGASPTSSDVRLALLRLIQELEEAFGIDVRRSCSLLFLSAVRPSPDAPCPSHRHSPRTLRTTRWCAGRSPTHCRYAACSRSLCRTQLPRSHLRLYPLSVTAGGSVRPPRGPLPAGHRRRRQPAEGDAPRALHGLAAADVPAGHGAPRVHHPRRRRPQHPAHAVPALHAAPAAARGRVDRGRAAGDRGGAAV